jgi:NRAMP (natural resistance-associated macrophage protein)-like metal ion transporter
MPKLRAPRAPAALRDRARAAADARVARREERARSARVSRFAGLWRYLAVLGPGLIVANAGNDAGGVFTYTQTGSKYGFGLLWAFIPILVALIVTQEMVARLGTVTGKGLMDLIRERFGVRWTLFVSVVVVIANGGTVLAEFIGVAGALGLLGVSKDIAVPAAAFLITFLVLRANRRLVERVFLALGLAFISYIVTAVTVHPDWTGVAHALIPTFDHSPVQGGSTPYTTDLITLIGTSITPYMQLFLQSSIVDKGTSEKELKYARADVIGGSFFAMAVAAFIVITTATTLFAHGCVNGSCFPGNDLSSTQDAALALQPLAGEHAKQLFAVGLLGASLLAAAVLPLSTAFVICEAFGAERSVQRKYREAPLFFTLFLGIVVIGAGAVLFIAEDSLTKVAVQTQTLDGILLPVLLVFILVLANDRRLLGRHRNRLPNNVIAIALTTVLTVLTAVLVLGQFVSL